MVKDQDKKKRNMKGEIFKEKNDLEGSKKSFTDAMDTGIYKELRW